MLRFILRTNNNAATIPITPITINVSASDAKSGIEVSGVDKMKIWENGTTEPSEWETYAATKSITLTEGDGSKTINAKFKDNAGHVSCAEAPHGAHQQIEYMKDNAGHIVFGYQCMKDNAGHVSCAQTPFGACAKDNAGRVTCQDPSYPMHHHGGPWHR